MHQLATENDVRYAESADYIPDADAEMCANTIERYLRSSFTGAVSDCTTEDGRPSIGRDVLTRT